MLETKKTKSFAISTTFILLVIALICSIGLGSVKFSPVEIVKALAGYGEQVSDTILWDIRIPRVLLAAVIGLNLAISGALLQAVMHNPLADPGLTGVSSGAAVAVLFILLVVPGYSSFIPIAAIAGGGLAAVMVYALAWKKWGITPVRVILSGVAVNSIFGGIIGLLSLLYSDKLPAALQWLNGSMSGKGMGDLTVMLPYSVAGWIAALFCIRKANVLRLGEQAALNLGENINRIRLLISFVAVYLAAVSVSTVGMIGFVGLVVPHMARMLVGSDYRKMLPMSMGLGALVLLVADTAGRTLFAPLDIPAGIVMAVAGGPYFLYLMRKGDI
ncbi:FecCD family ABC transporter permease [Paenibacillus dokdonensis]|uniref:FecCD family ABC transporter permease n=1 Tax=Paenibacillus dokdonensis TaxID=2567944 RepID=UPI003CCC735F